MLALTLLGIATEAFWRKSPGTTYMASAADYLVDKVHLVNKGLEAFFEDSPWHHSTDFAATYQRATAIQELYRREMLDKDPRRAVDLHHLYIRYFDMFLCGIVVAIFLLSCIVVVLCVYDGIAHWRYVAYFRDCRSQVLRIQSMFEKTNLQLCPICIKKVNHAQSSQNVIFLCGHGFHTECANRWYRKEGQDHGICPICNVCDNQRPTCGTCDEIGENMDAAPVGIGFRGEDKAFYLRSLSERFPEFVTKECARRWANCHTELWLQELDCPRYQSIFTWHKAEPTEHSWNPLPAVAKPTVPWKQGSASKSLSWR